MAQFKFTGRLLASLLSLAAVLALALGPQASRADVKQKLYLIQGQKVQSVVSAVSQLRQFLSQNLSEHQRCQRYSIVLNAYQLKKSTLTNFQIAEISQLKREEVEKRFNAIGIETLRDLYIAGVQSALEAGLVNGAVAELYECLGAGFRHRDAKARSFLNNDEVRLIVEQYKSIAEQPARLLADEATHHPNLRLDQLHPTVARSVAHWFQGDEFAVARMFEQHNGQALPVSPAPMPVPVQAPVPQAVYANAQAQATTTTQTNAHAQAQAQAGQQGARAEATATATTAGAPPSLPAHVDHATVDPAEDDASYLGYVFGSVIAAYETLPVETSLGDRCRAYSQIVEANREDLFRETYVEELVQRVSGEKLAARGGPANEPFVPDQSERENFIFVVQTLDPLQGGSEAWTDMVDCVRQWESLDPEAGKFMHSPELAQTFEQILAMADAADAAERQQQQPQPAGPPADGPGAAAAAANAAAYTGQPARSASPAPTMVAH